jgi:hypothetical protein
MGTQVQKKPLLVETPKDQNPGAFAKGRPPVMGFPKGVSGNPGGGRKLAKQLREVAQGHGDPTLNKLMDFVRGMVTGPHAVTHESKDEKTGRKIFTQEIVQDWHHNVPLELQLKAIEMMLERAMGKVATPVEFQDNEGGPAQINRVERVILHFDGNGRELRREDVPIIDATAREVREDSDGWKVKG